MANQKTKSKSHLKFQQKKEQPRSRTRHSSVCVCLVRVPICTCTTVGCTYTYDGHVYYCSMYSIVTKVHVITCTHSVVDKERTGNTEIFYFGTKQLLGKIQELLHTCTNCCTGYTYIMYTLHVHDVGTLQPTFIFCFTVFTKPLKPSPSAPSSLLPSFPLLSDHCQSCCVVLFSTWNARHSLNLRH